MAVRIALVSSPSINLDVVKRYLPSNYTAVKASIGNEDDPLAVLIVGKDNAGWTLDGYVIPRLASGMIFAKELTTDE